MIVSRIFIVHYNGQFTQVNVPHNTAAAIRINSVHVCIQVPLLARGALMQNTQSVIQ